MNVNQIKILTYIYLTALLLATLLPLNAQDSALNNNYTLLVRWDYLLHALVYLPLPALTFATLFIRDNSTKIRANSSLQKFANSPARNHASSRKFHANSGARNSLTVLLISLTIGIGLELLQMLVPYRSFNINDLIANVVGVLLGLALVLVVRKRIMKIG